MRRILEFTFQVSRCLNCALCPQDKLASAYQSDIRKLTVENQVRMLHTVPPEVMFQASGFSEPFLHEDAGEFIAFAHAKRHPVSLYTTLVGLRDTHMLVLPGIPFKWVRIHAPDLKHFTTNEDVWIRNLDRFTTLETGYTVMAMGPVSEKIQDALLSRGISLELPDMLSRAGNLGWKHPERTLGGPITCKSSRWLENVILPDGTVVMCSMLYQLEVVFGNLLTDPYSKIEAAALAYAKNFDQPENSPCRVCDWGGTPDL